jgi:putative sterol carrier protein
MRWTNAEVAAHLVSTVIEIEKAVRGGASAYDATGPNATVDEQLVAATPQRDPQALAELLQEHTVSCLGALRQADGATPTRAPRIDVCTIGSLLALDHHLHGGQIAEASRLEWAGAVRDMFYPLTMVLQYAFDPTAARGFHGTFELRVKGVDPIRYAVDDGQLTTGGGADRADCKITADPKTFLRYNIGAYSQARAVLTGKVRAGGRKPWLALANNRFFPLTSHGGVARKG